MYFFELSTLDIYVQNNKAKKFRQFIIKKTCIIKVFANLLYNL